METHYLSPGNKKTGDTCSFDITPINTCPGATSLCANSCYAENMRRAFPGAKRKYTRNYRFSKSAKFVSYMVDNLPTGTCRIHVSGDFYSTEYILRWLEIVQARTDVRFYFYTRSWRIPELWWALKVLAGRKNVTMNLSVDKETGKPTVSEASRFMWCYLTITDDDVPSWLRRRDLVFRHLHKYDMRYRPYMDAVHRLGANSTRVCPLERSVKVDLTCSQCGICMV